MFTFVDLATTVLCTQTICDAACQARVPTLTADPLTGQLVLYDPVSGNATTLSPADIAGFHGSVPCSSSSSSASAAATSNSSAPAGCKLVTVELSAAGFAGLYGLGSAIEAAAVASSASGNSTRRRLTTQQRGRVAARIVAPLRLPHPPLDVRRLIAAREGSDGDAVFVEDGGVGVAQRRLGTDNSSVGVPSVTRPIVCLELGQGLVFNLPAGKTSYPVYVKDSFLNTNPAFDYGEFRTLAEMAAACSPCLRPHTHRQDSLLCIHRVWGCRVFHGCSCVCSFM